MADQLLFDRDQKAILLEEEESDEANGVENDDDRIESQRKAVRQEGAVIVPFKEYPLALGQIGLGEGPKCLASNHEEDRAEAKGPELLWRHGFDGEIDASCPAGRKLIPRSGLADRLGGSDGF